MSYTIPMAAPDTAFIDCDAEPFVYEGMSVHQHHKGGQMAWDASKIELWLSEEQKSGLSMSGHALLDEVSKKNPFNVNVLSFLVAHMDLIPKEWEEQRIIFWGTVYLNGLGGLCIASLTYGERGWNVEMKYLDENFSEADFAAIPLVIQ